MKIEQKDEYHDDYLVEVKRPDGKTIQILIPKDDLFWTNTVYGLNFVTRGHYM